MLHKLIMQLAKEKWGMNFVLLDPENQYQIYPNNTTYLYQEAHLAENSKIMVSIPNKYLSISTIEELEQSMNSLCRDTTFDLLEGTYGGDDHQKTVIEEWMNSFVHGGKFLFVDEGDHGCEMCTVDNKGRAYFRKIDKNGNWSHDFEASQEMLTLLSPPEKSKTLSIIVSEHTDHIKIDYTNVQVIVPTDFLDEDYIIRFFIEENVVIRITIYGYDRSWKAEAFEYTLTENGMVEKRELETVPLPVAESILVRLASRGYVCDSPILTAEEREYILSSNATQPSLAYHSENLFVGYAVNWICMKFPGVGWVPVNKAALDLETLPENIKKEIALYKNL